MRTTRLGESIGEPGPPSPVWATLDCNGKCIWCEWERQCGGLWWEVVREKLKRRHRLEAIRISLEGLEHHNEGWYHAVWQFYIDPPEDECFQLSDLCRVYADAGVEWMAREIPGEIVPLDGKRRTLTEQIWLKREEGLSIRQIGRALSVKKCVVENVLAGKNAREDQGVLSV